MMQKMQQLMEEKAMNNHRPQPMKRRTPYWRRRKDGAYIGPGEEWEFDGYMLVPKKRDGKRVQDITKHESGPQNIDVASLTAVSEVTEAAAVDPNAPMDTRNAW